jgi:uncharacterized protein YndB with AHSA1/START domain
MKKNEKPIIVEETYVATPDTVWKAITEANQMRKWFFENIPDFKPIVGSKVEFNVDSGGRIFPHLWRVTRVIPEKLIEINWKYGGYPGDSLVLFELSKEMSTTKLRLTHTVVEEFPEDIPGFQRDSCIAGWRYFINQRLKQYLGSIP